MMLLELIAKLAENRRAVDEPVLIEDRHGLLYHIDKIEDRTDDEEVGVGGRPSIVLVVGNIWREKSTGREEQARLIRQTADGVARWYDNQGCVIGPDRIPEAQARRDAMADAETFWRYVYGNHFNSRLALDVDDAVVGAEKVLEEFSRMDGDPDPFWTRREARLAARAAFRAVPGLRGGK